jgi:hypothetical protein
MVTPGPDRGGTYRVKTDEESLVWFTDRLEVPMDQFVESYFHTHGDMLFDMFYFQVPRPVV